MVTKHSRGCATNKVTKDQVEPLKDFQGGCWCRIGSKLWYKIIITVINNIYKIIHVLSISNYSTKLSVLTDEM